LEWRTFGNIFGNLQKLWKIIWRQIKRTITVEGNILSGLPTERKVDGMAEKYVQEKLKQVRRQLFCDERPRSPTNTTSSFTPISYSPNGNSTRTVFFMGYKLESDKNFMCATCFGDKFRVIGEINTKYMYSGEISEQEFLKRKEPYEQCSRCGKYLTIVRPYDSVHLDFA